MNTESTWSDFAENMISDLLILHVYIKTKIQIKVI